MFSSPILDIAVSLAFTYLLLAIIASSANEWILNSVLNTRAKDLKNSIENLLFDPQWKAIAGKLVNSPFITSLKRTGESFPSYIPAKNFAQAVTQIIKEDVVPAPAGIPDVASLKILVAENRMITGEAEKVLTGLLDSAEDSLEKFQKGLEDFYNDAMDRATGWYKKKAKRAAFIIAVIIAFALNVDTIQITKTLWQQPQLAKQAADYAAANISAVDTSGGKFAIKESKLAQTDTTIKKSSSSGDTTVVITNQNIRNMHDAKSMLEGMSLPIGWADQNIPSAVNGSCDFLGWLSKLIGLLLTAGAVSLGAPFWFDLANKFINIRNSGARPETEQNGKKNKK